MSATGQKLWLWSKGSVDGPQQYQLNRFSVLPSLYELSPLNTAVKLNPFAWRSDFAFDEKLGSTRWGIVNDLVGTMVIEPKELLSRAWSAASAGGLTEQDWQRLAAMPISAAEALDFAKNKWQDPAFRNQKLVEWSQFARAKYQTGIKRPAIRTDWLSLLAPVIIALGLIMYTRNSES
jgi:hypothetical protein